jgi:hypothetical protein
MRSVLLRPLNVVNQSYFSVLSLLLFFFSIVVLIFFFPLVNFIVRSMGRCILWKRSIVVWTAIKRRNLLDFVVHSMEAIDHSVNCNRAPKPLGFCCAFCGSDRSQCELRSSAETSWILLYILWKQSIVVWIVNDHRNLFNSAKHFEETNDRYVNGDQSPSHHTTLGTRAQHLTHT